MLLYWIHALIDYDKCNFLHREEIERFVENGTLSHLKVCFSRAELDSSGSEPEPKYVQHNLLLQAEHVVRILLKENGCLYVCGWVGSIPY